MKYEATIYVDRHYLTTINKYLTEEPTSESECLGENETITRTANFLNGCEMDIKCCGVKYQEGEINLAWTEAVLFCDGCEIACSEVREAFDGDWELEDHYGNIYVVHVVSDQ